MCSRNSVDLFQNFAKTYRNKLMCWIQCRGICKQCRGMSELWTYILLTLDQLYVKIAYFEETY